MKPGISSYAFSWAVQSGNFTPDTLLHFAAEHQLPVVQYGDHVRLHRLSPEELDALAHRARELNISLETGARGLTPSHLDRYIEISRKLNARLLRFVIDEGSHEPGWGEITSILIHAVPSLQQAGLILGIENHDRFPSADLRRMVDRIGSEHVGICLDTANSLGAGEGIHEVLAHLAPVCVNLHVKDYWIERVPNQMGFVVSGRALGEGKLPLHEVLSTVSRLGRCPSAILETWPPPRSELSLTLAQEKEWAIRSIQNLRHAISTIPQPTSTPASKPSSPSPSPSRIPTP